MWFRKKQKNNRFFGSEIPPSCSYCAHNSGTADKVVCSQKRVLVEGRCKKYLYNPLMREPRKKPSLQTEGLTKEDFQL